MRGVVKVVVCCMLYVVEKGEREGYMYGTIRCGYIETAR